MMFLNAQTKGNVGCPRESQAFSKQGWNPPFGAIPTFFPEIILFFET
jgi:hypothetical protein